MKKILVIGAGNVGAHIINHGIAKDLGADFYLMDLNEELTKAQLLDLKDTLLFSGNSRVHSIKFGDPMIHDMDIIVITAGANQAPGETRCDLLDKNAKILQDIAKGLSPIKEDSIIMLVTNPVDIITKMAQDIFPVDNKQILGTGTLLDSARLRWRAAEHLAINVKSSHGYVLGEHGDSEFVAWSTVNFPHLFSDEERLIIEDSVRKEAYDIIQGKGSTYFGVAAATVKLLNAIMHDSRSIFPVSTSYPHFEDAALRDTPLGVPAVISKHGIDHIPPLHLDSDEDAKLAASAQKLKGLYEDYKAQN